MYLIAESYRILSEGHGKIVLLDRNSCVGEFLSEILPGQGTRLIKSTLLVIHCDFLINRKN
jgi:hypothetical protein